MSGLEQQLPPLQRHFQRLTEVLVYPDDEAAGTFLQGNQCSDAFFGRNFRVFSCTFEGSKQAAVPDVFSEGFQTGDVTSTRI